MSNRQFPLTVTLRSNDGKVVRQGTIKSRTDSCPFNSVPPGRYTVSGLFADGSKTIDKDDSFSIGNSCRTYYLANSGIQVSSPPPAQTPPRTTTRSKLPVKAIISFAIPAALASHFGGAAPLTKEISNSLLRPRTTASSTQASSGTTFSKRVEAQLKVCIKNNARELSGIPTLAKLLRAASWEREVEDEFEQELIALYADYEQLRTAINRCDPRLAQEVIAARAGTSEPDERVTVFVADPLVNVRGTPNGQIIKALPYGTSVFIDQLATARLSEDQKLAIEQGAGWQPIILSSGEAGYIYSLHISDSL